MGADDATPPPDTAGRILRLDELCDRYEDECRAGRAPDPAAYLAAVGPGDRPALGEALARIDADYRTPPAPPVRLVVTAGPHTGQEFTFDAHDTFLVGRSKDAHFRLTYDDPYFSRRHFLVEVNPPRVRVFDLDSRNGIAVNGARVRTADLTDGDELKAGHTVFRVSVPRPPDPDDQPTLALPPAPPPARVEESGLGIFDYVPVSPPKPPPAPAATIDHVPGVVIPGYRFEVEIGRGAMGTVYRAVREADGVPVAVKVITPAAGVGGRQVGRFLREARILSELDHPNIVRRLDGGERGGLVYLVMELVDGPDAARLVKTGGPLDVTAAVRLTIQALDGLAHAHARGFVHRDVKPANLLVAQEGGKRVVKVADFGLARAFDACGMSGLTLNGEVGGTPAFMAPEQVTHYRDAKPAADQYAAAATLYYLLTGRYVLDFAAGARDHLVEIVTAPRVPVRARRPDVPDGLAGALGRALAMEPDDRFPDVSAFRKALHPFAT